MTVTHGMDTESGRAAAGELERGAVEIEALGVRLDALINGFEWSGVDAERTRDHWQHTERPRLVLVSRHLSELAVSLEKEADTQDVVSGVTSDGASGTWAEAPAEDGLLGWLGNRLEAIGAGLRRQGTAAADLGSKVIDVLTGRKEWSLAAILSSALGNAGAAIGTAANAITGEDQRWFAESRGEAGTPVQVPEHSTDPDRPALTVPTDTATLMQGVADAYGAGGANGGDVRVTAVTNADGTTGYVVAIPGTEKWSPAAVSKVRDLTANLDLMAGRPTAAVESVRRAMEAAGVPDGAHVMLVGHSQGGIIAGELASDPAFRGRYDVSHVLTFGAPIDHLDLDPATRVLQVQHKGDVVPTLDLGGERVRLGDPWPERAQTVTLPGPGGPLSVVENHNYVRYVDSVNTATQTNSEAGRVLRGWQDDPSMAVFLVGHGDQASAVDVPIRRGDPR